MNERKILVIDDKRTFNFPATYARTLPEGIWHLFTGGYWDEVWLDHDMGDPSYEMMTLVNLLENMANSESGSYSGPEVGKYVIHTANPVARENMAIALRFLPTEMVRANDYLE